MRSEIRSNKRVTWFFAADGLLISAIVVSLYTLLMRQYPIIYGGDTITRLVNPSRILNGHQLPLLQTLIYLALRIAYNPNTIFLLMAFISAAACLGFYALTYVLTGSRRASWIVSILYATHPFILYYSRVPYQEPLLLAGMAWGFYYLFRPASRVNRLLASLFFAIACFSRYEGWIAALAAAIFELWRIRERKGRAGFASLSATILRFGWAPAIWIVWNKDLSPAGSYVLDLGLQWSKLYRPYFISKSAIWWTPSVVVLLALVGFAYSWLDSRMRKDPGFYVLLGTVALFMTVLIFSGHGIDPDPSRILTEREAFVPVAILVLYGGIGANWLIGSIETYNKNLLFRFGFSLGILVMVVGYGLDSGFRRIAMANADPDLKTDYEIARVLASRHSRGLVLAAPLPEEPMKNYLNSVERWSGLAGKRKAADLLKQAETTPLDYQRILAYSWMGKDNVFPGDGLRGMDPPGVQSFLREKAVKFIIVFSDFVPVAEHERSVLDCGVTGRSPELEIRNDGKVGRIYSVQFPPNAAGPNNP